MPNRSQRGRPRKYGRPARAVTVTLPDDVLTRLSAIHSDIGTAIVQLVEKEVPARGVATPPVEVTRYGNRAVILVTPSRALKKLRGVQLVPIGNGRALISLAPPMSIPALELQVRDLLETGAMNGADRSILSSLADFLKRGRAARDLVFEPRTIIVLATRVQRGTRED